MKDYSIQEIKKAYFDKGYVFFDGKNKPFNVNIFGIRDNNLTVDNLFDDKIGIIYSLNNQEQLLIVNATTQPGKYYMLHPMNKNGSAIIVPGQYRSSYSIGLHYKDVALVQTGKLRIYRDSNLDLVYNYDKSTIIDSIGDGLNIHHAGGDSKLIDNWSAGCQVVSNMSNWNQFIGICLRAKALYSNKFTYTLFTTEDFI